MKLSEAQLRRALQHLQSGDWQAAHGSNARYWYAQAKRSFPEQPSAKAEIAALSAKI